MAKQPVTTFEKGLAYQPPIQAFMGDTFQRLGISGTP